MDLWEVLKASKGVPITSDMYDALFGKALGGAGSVWETENAPYLFRRSGGSLRTRLLGKEKDCIVGASVGWNQLVKIPTTDASKTENGVTITDNRDGSYTVSTTAEGATSDVTLWFNTTQNKNHKLLVYGCPPNGSLGTYYVYDGWTGSADIGSGKMLIGVSNTQLGIRIKSGTIITTAKVFKPQLIDLTLMFGSTIADYAYTLETQQAGKGIAWLKSYGFFGEPYYEYNAGELKSVEARSHITVGFNQWDEEWESGAYDTNTGAKISYTGRIRNKNLVPILPSTTYYVKAPVNTAVYWKCFYDANGDFIKTTGSSSNATFTSPSDAHYMAFYTESSYGSGTYNHDICINISNADKNGTYEPYHADTYALDSDLVLRGVPKMDADHNLYYDGDTYESSGKVTRKYGVVDLGSLDWLYVSSATRPYFRYELTSMKPCTNPSAIQNMVCSKYPTETWGHVLDNDGYDKHIAEGWGGKSYVVVRDTAYTDAPTFKTAMSGVYLVYELATPTTETAEPFASPQKVDGAGTEQYITTQNFVPIGHETEYKCSPTP